MDTKLQEYAKLLIEVGLNVQKGQTLIISSPVECASFARLCADAAYDAGCREVIMNWVTTILVGRSFSGRTPPFSMTRRSGAKSFSPAMRKWEPPIWPLPPAIRKR